MAYTDPEENEPEGIKLEPTLAEIRYMGFLAGLAGRPPVIPQDETTAIAYNAGYVTGALARQTQPGTIGARSQAVTKETGSRGQDIAAGAR